MRSTAGIELHPHHCQQLQEVASPHSTSSSANPAPMLNKSRSASTAS
jgi:hypothetical protein